MARRGRYLPRGHADRLVSTPRERGVVLLVVFGVALALRVFHVWEIRRAPFFDLKLGDAAAYDAWARQIVAGEWLGREVFYQAPLYPYVLALVYTLVGTSTLTVRLFQAVLSAGSCALLADAGWRLFSKRTGIAAGLMLATYPPAIFLDTLLQKSALDLFFLSLVLWLVSRLLSALRRSICWQLGLAVACLTLTRENAGILVVPILIWLALQRSVAIRGRVVFGALFLAGLATILVPVAVRNEIVGHEFFVTTSQFGPNLYIGNNERSDGTYRPLRPFREKAAFERQDAADLPEQALGRPLTPGEVSSYYTRQVLNFVRTQPGRWLRLLFRKFVLTWNASEISDTEDQYTYAHWSLPLRFMSAWNLGVLAPIAVLGIWITWADRRRLWVLHLMLAMYIASVILFYVFARYRFPLVPFLVLFAAAGLTGLREFLRRHQTPQIAGCAIAVGAVAVFCNLPVVPQHKLEAVTHYNHGVGLEANGQADNAVREYQAAVQLDPGLVVAHNDLGLLLAARGRLAEASIELGQAVRLAPDYAKAHNNLGVVAGRQAKWPEAVAQFEEAVRLAPSYAEANGNLAAVLTEIGHRDRAISVLQQALALSPRDARLRNRLASLFVQGGRLDAAAAELRRAIEAAPDEADVHNNLGIVLAQQGDLTAAAAEFERALALNPNDAQTQRNLERIRAGR